MFTKFDLESENTLFRDENFEKSLSTLRWVPMKVLTSLLSSTKVLGLCLTLIRDPITPVTGIYGPLIGS